jgi:hypothetical protein
MVIDLQGSDHTRLLQAALWENCRSLHACRSRVEISE